VTYLNIDNQKYLIEEKSCVLIRCLCRYVSGSDWPTWYWRS